MPVHFIFTVFLIFLSHFVVGSLSEDPPFRVIILLILTENVSLWFITNNNLSQSAVFSFTIAKTHFKTETTSLFYYEFSRTVYPISTFIILSPTLYNITAV